MSGNGSRHDGTILGVDIQSGDVRGDSPAYAIVSIDGESIERDVVSLRKLRRIIATEAPSIVATDNVFELVADKGALIQFLHWLPSTTRLVQVTGAERPEPLSRVADRHNVPYGKDPMAEAEAAARLAQANVGYRVTAFDDTTRIKVSRGRSTGKGGWSEDRFTRRIHGSVKRGARAIESTLEGAGFTFDRSVTEKYGGYANAVFTVEARPEDIPVSRSRSGDVRVEIDQVRRDGIEFEPLVTRRDHVIVGIDPGTTTAVAIVDIDGDVLDVVSTRTADTAAVINWIVDRGRPFLIATDVTPMPATVEKIRRSFDAGGWEPTTDLPVDEKLHRTNRTGYDNEHERDAIAAALFAVDDHADQFERIGRKVPPHLDSGEVIARVVSGEESVEAVLREMTETATQPEESETSTPAEPGPGDRRLNRLERQVDRLEEQVRSMRSTIEAKNDRIDELESELTEAKREERQNARERRIVARLERENSRLSRELDRVKEERSELARTLDRLKALWKLDHSNLDEVAGNRDLVSVKPVEKFTIEAIEAAHEKFGLIEDDVVLIRDATGAGRRAAQRLIDIEPRVILKRGGLPDVADSILFEADIPVRSAESVAIYEIDDLAVASGRDLDRVIDEWREHAKERRRNQNMAMVDQLITEHRSERGRADGEP